MFAKPSIYCSVKFAGPIFRNFVVFRPKFFIFSNFHRFFCGKMAEKMEAPFGAWQSPISSSMLTANCRKFEEVRVDATEKGKGVVYWSEGRPWEAGRSVICSKTTGGKILEWTPANFNVRSQVHEYGGGAFFVHNGVVYFSNRADRRIYRQEGVDKEPTPITAANDSFFYADGCFNNGFIYYVREEHAKDRPEPINTLVSINAENGVQTILAKGADFYASPKVSSDGLNIIWMQWNHPNMPWDDTEIWMANLSENGTVQTGSERKIAGSSGKNFMQARFSPCGKIFYICDETDWWNLYEFTDFGNHHNVQPLNRELGGPHWIFGTDAYSFDPKNNGDVAVAFGQELGVVNLKSELYYKQETGFSSHQYINFGRDGCVYCKASGPTKFPSIIRWNVTTGETEVIQESRGAMDESYLSIPEHIAFRTGCDSSDVAYGFFYAPKNPVYKGRPKTLPPLVVMAHGGPTGSTTSDLDLRLQFLTSRGFAVLDVNYRGSTGYGKKFRDSLLGKWGIYDVEDCCAGALHLAKEDRVDGAKLAITGRSAGGYTVLACLTFRDVFKVGVSHYGIGDLEAIQKETHKFESQYNCRLIGPFPEEVEEYRKRSPIFHVDRLNCPVAFFQGLDDKVVSPQQAETMYEVLLKKGIPTALVLFEGEGHGFRKADSIQLSVDGEFYFFCKIFGIPIKEDLSKEICIRNYDVTLLHKLSPQICL